MSKANAEVRTEFCWFSRGNRSVWSSEELACKDAEEMKQDGARIQRRIVIITEWEDVQ